MNIKLKLPVLTVLLNMFFLSYSMDLKKIMEHGLMLDNIEDVKKALEAGFDVNSFIEEKFEYRKFDDKRLVIKEQVGHPPLTAAITYCALNVISLLLSKGADISYLNIFDQSHLDNAKGYANNFYKVGTGRDINSKKVLELLQDWQKKLKKEVKKEVDSYLLPVLGDIVADYLV